MPDAGRYRRSAGFLSAACSYRDASTVLEGTPFLTPPLCSVPFPNLLPGLHRQILFGGLRIGMYEPVKGLFVGKDHTGDISLGTKIAAGLTTGALGIAVASPTDLVKVRMQSEGKLAPGQARRYPSAFAAYGIIARQEGVRALWTGLGPNMARNAIINAAELASYDQIKQTLLRSGVFNDDIYCHIASGLGAGFFAVCVGSPVDVVKSRMMGAAPGVYSGVIDTFIKTARKDGVLAFYSGFGPNFARLGTCVGVLEGGEEWGGWGFMRGRWVESHFAPQESCILVRMPFVRSL